jgi:3-oxoacyl-[acyl-carrier protein] reductase
MKRLEGKTALVTGSGRNIGRAIILKLAEEGANVVVNARSNKEEAESVAAEARALGVEALPFLADVSDHQQVTTMFAAAAEKFGGVDILVSNAAIRPHKPFTETTLEDWEWVRGVVLDGAFYCAHAAIPSMAKNEYGRVVFFTGDGAFKGTALRAPVSAAKMGIIGLARGLASEFAPKNIRVNVISPGRIDTSRDLSWYPQGGMRDTADIPVGRLGSVNDIAAACLFLVTDDCGFMTGQTLHVNGGTDFF